MKKIISISLMAIALLATQVNAQLFFTTSYKGTVAHRTSGGETSYIPVSGNSLEACNNEYSRIVATVGSAYLYDQSTRGCFAQHSQVSVDMEKIMPKIELPPSCIYCGYLSMETIPEIFPNSYGQVKYLYYKYNVDVYNEEIKNLQTQFNISAFEQELANVIRPKDQ